MITPQRAQGITKGRPYFWVTMKKDERMKYWLNTATQDWKVAGHLFEKGDYSYALFFGHLTLEKTLKAIYVKKQDETPPFSHNLVYLSEKAGLELQQDNLELLEEISDYNLEARYPDDKFSFLIKMHEKIYKQ